MHRAGHHLTGGLTGIAVGTWLKYHAGADVLTVASAVGGGWYGGIFPDAIEKIGKLYWIEHRTVTHWVPLWIGLLVWAVVTGVHLPLPYPDIVRGTVLGFIFGGLTHLIFDIPNPTGIPLVLPWKRYSLNWWKSGRADIALVALWGVGVWGFYVLQS